MLLRGRRSSVGVGPGPIHDVVPEPERRLGRTPIYARDPLRNWTAAGEEAPRSPSERLEAIMRDGRFHEVADVVHAGLSFALLLAAMDDLLRAGLAFDRVGTSLRLRILRRGEAPQELWILAGGLESPEQVALEPEAREVEDPVDLPEQLTEDPASGGDLGSARASEPGLVLSDPPGDLTMPTSQLGSLVCAMLAKRGSGKSYLGMVLVEEILREINHPRVVIFDPTGAWWGLGASAGGGSPPHEVAIVGGPRGHVPLAVGDGGKLARVASEVDCPLVVDLSEMAPAEQHEIVADFCEALMGLPAFPIHVVIDEADEFAPQQCDGISEHQSRARGWLVKLVMRGRKRGVGATLISLRPAILSKNVLSQVDVLFLLRMVETNDLRAVEAWLENFEGGVSAEHRARCLGSLPLLPVGTAYYLRGGDEVTFRRFRTRRKLTYDSSRTPDGVVREAVVLERPRPEILGAVGKILAAPTARTEK